MWGNDIMFGRKERTKIVGDERVTIEVELESLGGKQSASFSVSGHTTSKYARRGGQIQHNFIGHFPEFEPYYCWHLVSVDTGPIHYVANAVYHMQLAEAGGRKNWRGELEDTAETCREYAERSAHWGVLPDEEKGGMQLAADRSGLTYRQFFEARLPALMAAFYAAMAELFGLDTLIRALTHAVKMRGGLSEDEAVKEAVGRLVEIKRLEAPHEVQA